MWKRLEHGYAVDKRYINSISSLYMSVKSYKKKLEFSGNHARNDMMWGCWKVVHSQVDVYGTRNFVRLML